MAEISPNITKAKQWLEKGEVIGIPTETVYGLAGNALDAGVVVKIFEVKQRPSFDPLIVHAASLEQIETFVIDIPAAARRLASTFWPGPMTLLLQKKNSIPAIVTAGLDTVAVRIPDNPLTLNLLNELNFPLAAPSANPFGYISPTTAMHVSEQLGNSIPFVLDGGKCKVGIESTIVGFEGEVPTIYRLGGLDLNGIEKIVGKVNVRPHSTSNPKAPGMLKSHYAPKKPVYLHKTGAGQSIKQPSKVGWLGFDRILEGIPSENQRLLSPTGDLNEAARNLFAYLRELDNLDLKMIYTELVPDEGLGKAINDRLKRAIIQ